MVKRPKMYFFDTGLAAYLCGITDAKTLQNSFLKGRFFETFVFNEIRKSFMNEGIMQTLYYYRDSEQNEVDMILVREGKISCVEIKAGQNFNASDTKAFKNLINSKFVHGKTQLSAQLIRYRCLMMVLCFFLFRQSNPLFPRSAELNLS